MAIIDDALATGGDPNVSDAFTINGQPGDLYNCSNGMLYKDFLFIYFCFKGYSIYYSSNFYI